MGKISGKSITNYTKERKYVILFAVGVMTILMLPYVIGYSTQNEAWKFSGFVIGMEDGNSYIAKMLRGASGDWLFRTPYSAQEQKGVLAFLPYLILGKLASRPAQHGQLVAIYHWFRFFGGTLAIIASYDFLSIFLKEEKWKWWALIVITLGGGGGWVLVILEQKDFLGSLPLEFISPESFGFMGLLGFPHLALARACFLWGFCLYLRKTAGIFIGISWTILGLFQPIYVVVAWVLVSIHLLILTWTAWKVHFSKWSQIFKHMKDSYILALQGVLISSPLILYTAISFITDDFLKSWAQQNRLPSPHLMHYLIAYGMFIPFLIPGIKTILLKNFSLGTFLAGWLIVLPILVQAPVSTQRRLAEGIWIAVISTAAIWFERKKTRSIYSKALLYMSLPSTIFIFWGALITAGSYSTPLFRPAAEIDIYNFLSENTLPGSVVLTAYDTGNNLPAWSPNRVVLGHGPETMNREEIEQEIGLFYSDRAEEEYRQEIIEKYGINYVVIGPIERKIGSWNPGNSLYLIELYINGEYSVYQTLAYSAE